MSKTLISVLVLALVIVGGYFIVKANKGGYAAPTVSTEENTSDTSNIPAQSGKKIAFSEFVKQGGSYKCDVKQAMSDFENSGVVYMSGGKIRGDFSTIAEGRPIDSSFVVKDGYTYMWSSALPTMGFKVKVNADATASGEYNWQEGVGDYNCEPWTADEATFTLPASVTFKAQ
ncbi:MAG TPA: hypothetical protein VGO63_02165 [Candidatus Paceibacterota bacterium]|jgi:hypothetical protein|nr:hypothetical protein [Candidatus Paceibacterota bacterium]